MKLKKWIAPVVILVILVFLLIGFGGPLLVRLGIEPVCIQGDWPHIKIVSCGGSTAQQAIPPRPLPTPGAQGAIPLIVDDDGSPDGMIALLYFLRNPLFQVKAVTVSYGEAHPELFAPHLQRLLAGLGRTDIPVGAGRETPLAGDNAFPDAWRQVSDDFWGLDYPQAAVSSTPLPAAQLIVDTINAASQPVVIFVSGSHTNLAEALRLDPGIVEHIQAVEVMGGSLYVPGNIHSDYPQNANTVAEWNIWVDPLAAEEVFASGVTVHLAPLDATNRVPFTAEDARAWSASTAPEADLAADLLSWTLESWNTKSAYIWDLVAAIHLTDPSLCPAVPLSLDIRTAPGLEQGQMLILEQGQNTLACLEPDAAGMRALAATVFGR